MSGNLAQYAANMFPPFRYVVDKINAEGGIKSMVSAKIELVVADNASGSAGTASEARRLITQEKVCFYRRTARHQRDACPSARAR